MADKQDQSRLRSGSKDLVDAPQREMSFGDHLEELRWRLILALLGPIVACCITLPFGWKLVSLILAPLINMLNLLGLPPKAYALGIPTGFAIYAKVSLVAGLILAFPWVVYQIWKFVSPGLYTHERKVIVFIAPLSAFMSVLAVAFLYYVMLPISLGFLLYFTTSFPSPSVSAPGQGSFTQWLTGAHSPAQDGKITFTSPSQIKQWPDIPILKENPKNPKSGQMWIKMPQHELSVAVGGQVYHYMPFRSSSAIAPMIDINQYISFAVWLALGVLIAFQTPVVMLILGWSRVVDPRWLAKYRGYCILGIAILAAIFTPPDAFSMMVLMVPLYALFEVGLLLMRLAYKRN